MPAHLNPVETEARALLYTVISSADAQKIITALLANMLCLATRLPKPVNLHPVETKESASTSHQTITSAPARSHTLAKIAKIVSHCSMLIFLWFRKNESIVHVSKGT